MKFENSIYVPPGSGEAEVILFLVAQVQLMNTFYMSSICTSMGSELALILETVKLLIDSF